MCAIHPVFHVLQLEPASSSSIPGQVPTPPPPVLIEGKPEFEISKILDSKVDHHQCLCKLLYLVHWSRYEGTDEETSWILASELGNMSKFIKEFHQAYPHKPRPPQYEILFHILKTFPLFGLTHFDLGIGLSDHYFIYKKKYKSF